MAALQEQQPSLVACGYMAFVQDAVVDTAPPSGDANYMEQPSSKQPGSQQPSSQGAVAAQGSVSADGTHHIPRSAPPAGLPTMPFLPVLSPLDP